MSINVDGFQSAPTTIPTSGGPVAFRFQAVSTGNPSHMRARIRIPDQEPFVFSPTQGSNPRELFFPGSSQQLQAPTQPTPFNIPATAIVPAGAAGPVRLPLKIHLELQGLNASGGSVGSPRLASLLITFGASLAQSLNLLSSQLNMTPTALSAMLGVAPSTLRAAMQGGNSPKSQAALDRFLLGR